MYGDKKVFGSIEEIGRYCVDLLASRINEAMYMLCLDAKQNYNKTGACGGGNAQ